MNEPITEQIMILGGGVDHSVESNERLPLMQASVERADRAGQYYHEHAATFMGKNAMILCTGGASVIYQGVRNVSKEQAEGTRIAEHLMEVWGVPSAIIETETESDTSTLNLVNSIEANLLNPHIYNINYPLGIVTHRHHYRRFMADLRDAGFSSDATFGIHPAALDSASRELISRGIRASFFVGVRRGDLVEMRRHSERITKVFSR